MVGFKMKLIHFSYRKVLLWVTVMHLLTIGSIQGQSWSIEYVLEGDSSVYSLSPDRVMQGQFVDFFFPAYKYYHTFSQSAIESARMENKEMIELKFDTQNLSFNVINFEADLYAEGIDTIQFFIRTTCDSLVLLNQSYVHEGSIYLPTIRFSVNIERFDFSSGIKSLQIIGKSKEENRRFVAGRLNGYKKIEFVAINEAVIDTFVSNYVFEKQSDTFHELPNHYLNLHGFNWYTQLVLEDCSSTYDSIQCISQYMHKNLMEYGLYDAYHIDKDELIKRNALLADTANSLDSYYQGLKEITSLLNSCHVRLSTHKIDEIESPLQSIYFYEVNNEIVVSAIFDRALESKIKLGDILLSINNISVDQLYRDFSTRVFASSPHQREVKITQKLLYMAREKWGDNLLIEFQGSSSPYTICLQTSNFESKKVIPKDFKILRGNVIEKYDDMLYFRPIFLESQLIPFVFSHKDDFTNSKGLIVDLRGCSGGDYSFCTFLSYLITKDNNILSCDSTQFNSFSNYIIKPSSQIHIKAPIVILVDARTVCFSELIINALRKDKHDVHIVGTSNTAGSAQFVLRTALPGNTILAHFVGITKDIFGNVIDDNIGVAPDTLIRFESYKDLFPYEDKVKKYALGYLKRINNADNYIQH